MKELASLQMSLSLRDSPRGGCQSPGGGRTLLNGYMHRIEVRAIGLISRRRYWFALSDSSSFLYWFKERDDVSCVGRLSLTGAAFTYDPRQKGRFEIHVGTEVHVLECSSDIQRSDWMRALQDARKRSWIHTHAHDENRDLATLSVSTPPQPSSSSNDESATLSHGDCDSVEVPSSPSAQALLDNLLGPILESNSSEDTEDGEDTTLPVDIREKDSSILSGSPSPSSRFYLNTDGQLNDISMEMPKEVLNAETVLVRMAEKTGEQLEKPMKALTKARASLRQKVNHLNRERDCEECKKHAVAIAQSEGRCLELEERVQTLEDMIFTLKKGLVVAQRQVETLKQIEFTKVDEDTKEFLLEKERQITDLQMTSIQQSRRIQELEEENRDLDGRVSELQASVEAFRDSVRTKEELIMRLCEEQGREREGSFMAEVEVPEGILVDVESMGNDESTRQLLMEESVSDVNEMRDLVEGYKTQNGFLNQEIVELHQMVQSLEERERKIIRQNYDIEACYYQLKSRYIMILNHFKSPEKPGKIMEPGVLRELLAEVSHRTLRESASCSGTDTLGFYLKPAANDGDLLKMAADNQEKHNEIIEATKLEQSEEVMRWLQSWDAFLVNWVGRPLVVSMELKNLVRSGVPPAYRKTVWKSLVQISVKEKVSELGNNYFDCMQKKSRAKLEGGAYDSAIKQIDLDLARTLPTNKNFDDPSSEKIESLRRVLYAFRYHNKDVGYCQGLNRLAAIALLYLNEEDAFWFVVACVESLQPPGYYTSTLIGAVADQKVLRELVQEKLPRLAAHLRSLEVDLSLFTLSWFLTCFVDVLPHSVYLSIFDVFLFEGNKVLFRFALGVLKLCEPSVLLCRTIGTVHACLSRASECVPDFKTLANVAFNDLNPFSHKMIETKRQLYLSQLQDQGYR